MTLQLKVMPGEDNRVRLQAKGSESYLHTCEGQRVGESPPKFTSFSEPQKVALIGRSSWEYN